MIRNKESLACSIYNHKLLLQYSWWVSAGLSNYSPVLPQTDLGEAT